MSTRQVTQQPALLGERVQQFAVRARKRGNAFRLQSLRHSAQIQAEPGGLCQRRFILIAVGIDRRGRRSMIAKRVERRRWRISLVADSAR